MFKKSVTRMENENGSSRAELNNPVLQDIIATNHVVLAKKPRQERLSRAGKAVIIMIILGLVAIGIIALTLVLAQSRNTLLALMSRSADENALHASNHSRFLLFNQENLTTIANEQTESENWSRSPVSLTSNNLRPLTTEKNVDISSSIMRTEQQNDYISSSAQSTKPLSSSTAGVNEQSTTIQTTVSNLETTSVPTSHQSSTTLMMTEEKSMTPTTTTTSEALIETSFSSPLMSTVDDTLSSIRDQPSEENSFTTFITRHFDIQTTAETTNIAKKKTTNAAESFKYKSADDDVMDDLLFS